MTPAYVEVWLEHVCLSASDIDCVTTVMLKILDGKCKMFAEEKHLMALLYDAVKRRPGERLDAQVHALIEAAGAQPDEAMRMTIYEQRLFAETRISRPVMKAFKARIRAAGLFDCEELRRPHIAV